jgi:hypothetical protein
MLAPSSPQRESRQLSRAASYPLDSGLGRDELAAFCTVTSKLAGASAGFVAQRWGSLANEGLVPVHAVRGSSSE